MPIRFVGYSIEISNNRKFPYRLIVGFWRFETPCQLSCRVQKATLERLGQQIIVLIQPTLEAANAIRRVFRPEATLPQPVTL
jgi:hypothetical protein